MADDVLVQEASLAPTARTWLTRALIASLVALVAILFWLSFADLTARETSLLGTLLALLSIIAGAGITHVYAGSATKAAVDQVRDFHQKNLRTYALKAAEKVNNLSKELGRLSTYLQEELQYTEYRTVEEELLAKEERIESAIHMILTLKSVNDTSLSDWQGVIGDELDQRRKQDKDIAEELTALVERVASLQPETVTKFDPASITEEITSLRRDIGALVTQVSGAPVRRWYPSSQVDVDARCPVCSHSLSFRQKAREGSTKAIRCKNCESELVSEYSTTKGFELRPRRNISELISCPACAEEVHLDLDEWPTASDSVKCGNCGELIRVARASGKLRTSLVRTQETKYALSKELIDNVYNALPPQPWPKQIHKSVAEKLELPPQAVQKAIQQLIYQGKVMDQIDGKICTTEEKIRIIRETGSKL